MPGKSKIPVGAKEGDGSEFVFSENPQEKGVIYGIGAWNVGEIKDTPYMQEAYEMGKMV